jgi:hypothetical protein
MVKDTEKDKGDDGAEKKLPRVSLEPVSTKSKLHYTILSDAQVPLTLQKANEYIDLAIFEGERDLSQGGIQKLLDEMQAGNFNPNSTVLAKARFKGRDYKINGQHMCWAVTFTDPFKLYTVRETYFEVHTLEALRALYGTYDRGRARTDSHMIKVVLVGTPTARGVHAGLLQRLASGFKFWHWDNDTVRRRIAVRDVAAAIVADESGAFNRTGLFLSRLKGLESRVLRVPVIAAMMATFSKSAKADQFWEPIVENLGLTSKRDPRYLLRKTLDEVSYRRTGAQVAKKFISEEVFFRLAISAYNHWRKNEEVQYLKQPKKRVKPI